MRRALGALGLFLAGCPYIPGKWEDYAGPPEQTQLLGYVGFFDPLGGYRADNTPYGVAIAGWLDVPEAGRTWLPAPGCVHYEPGEGNLDGAGMADPGASGLVFVGDVGNINAEWVADGSYFYGEFGAGAFEEGGSYALQPTTADGFSIRASNLFTFPSPLTYDGPEIDGQDLVNVDLGDLSWSWSDGQAGDRVMITASLRDDGFDELEHVICTVDAADGAVSVDDGLFDQERAATYVSVIIEHLHESGARIGDDTGGARVVAARGVDGILKLGAP